MTRPVLVAVDSESDALRAVEDELRDRYGRHYEVRCTTSPARALADLAELARDEAPVALALAGQWLGETTGSDLLDEVRRLHPHAARALLVPWGGWGDPATGEAIFHATVHGRIDHYVLRPGPPPDELFHQAVASFLLEWAEARRTAPHTVHVVGAAWSGRAYELRRTLESCAIPHAFCLADSPKGRELVARAGPRAGLPFVLLPDGTVLVDPTDAELAAAAGSPAVVEAEDVDLVIVGAGPAGLSAAVYAASEGLRTVVVDQGGIGGQATSSAMIRNYLGFPHGVGGRSLARRAYEQAWVFGAQFLFMQRVTALRRESGRLAVALADGRRLRAHAVVLATGATYRRLGVPALEALTGAGVHYGGSASEAVGVAGQDVFVLGGANSAGQAALHLARYARRVTLLARAASLDAGMSHYLVRQLAATPRVSVRLCTEVAGGGGEGRLERLSLRDRVTGRVETVAADALFLMIGARPHTAWLPPEVERDRQGFVVTGADLAATASWAHDREPFPFETSMRGVLAIGDVRHGSVKRVASAVGEGSVAIHVVHRLLDADAPWADAETAAAGLVEAGRPDRAVG